MLAPVRTVAPAEGLLTLDDVKAQCRIDSSDEDALVQGLIDAVTARLDGYSGILGRALIEQTWRQDFDGFDDALRLPLGDLMAVSSVTYYDGSNVSQTLATTIYTAFSDEIGPYVALKPDQSWPVTYSRADAVRVTWTAGFGAAATDVPQAIRHAALLMISQWYDNRSADHAMPVAADALLAPYRRTGT